MKIFFILTGLLLFMAQPALAEQYDIYLEMHQRSNHENDTKVNRAPMILPIEVVYDSDNHIVKVIKNCLLNSSPVYVTANRKENGSKKGHAWIIDGLGTITRHYVTSKHFEYTENWMNESEYYESFDDLRAKYHINSEYDYIEEDAGSYTSEYLLMNWGWDGRNNNVFISPGLSDSWTVGDYEL